jgi:DNA repair photolyase
MKREIVVQEAFDYENPPDSGRLTVLDAYDGCSINCPYCVFQRGTGAWNRNILVKMNICDVLEESIKDWQEDEIIYIGSKSDPYMPIEAEYELTRKCIQILEKYKIKYVVVSKSDAHIILRDIDLFKRACEYNPEFIFAVGFSNFNHYKNVDKFEQIDPFRTVNRLKSEGIEVRAFITPVLAGITDVENIIGLLDADIPVFLDKLRIDYEDKSGIDYFLKYIQKYFPHLRETYEQIIHGREDKYYMNICANKDILNRCQFVFPDSKI